MSATKTVRHADSAGRTDYRPGTSGPRHRRGPSTRHEKKRKHIGEGRAETTTSRPNQRKARPRVYSSTSIRLPRRNTRAPASPPLRAWKATVTICWPKLASNLKEKNGQRSAGGGDVLGSKDSLCGDIDVWRRADRVLHHEEELGGELEHVAGADQHVPAPPPRALAPEQAAGSVRRLTHRTLRQLLDRTLQPSALWKVDTIRNGSPCRLALWMC